MRVFRLAFFIPILIYTTGAMADACYEIYKTCQGSCVVSGSSDADKFFFKCGGKDGCANNAIVRVNPDIQFMYYHCNGTKWTKITENDLDKYAQNVRDCGIQDTDKDSLAGVYNGAEYDFFTEPHEGWLVGRSDICKKPKTNKVKKQKIQQNRLKYLWSRTRPHRFPHQRRTISQYLALWLMKTVNPCHLLILQSSAQ